MAKKEERRRKKKVKKPKVFSYGGRGPDPYHSLLNFIQAQAHDTQVASLLQQLGQAQAFAKNARRQALDEAYGRGPQPMEGITTGEPPVQPEPMEGITRDPPRATGRSRASQTPPPPAAPAMHSGGSQTSPPPAAPAMHSGGSQTDPPPAAPAASTVPGGTQYDSGDLAVGAGGFHVLEEMRSHIAHTTEPVLAQEVMRHHSTPPYTHPDRSHRGGIPRRGVSPVPVDQAFAARMNDHSRYGGAEHGGIPDPEELAAGRAAYKRATLEMRSRDDSSRSDVPRFKRGEWRIHDRDFKAPRVSEAGTGAGTFHSYMKDRMLPDYEHKRPGGDAGRSGYTPLSRASTGYQYKPVGRPFKAARVDRPTARTGDFESYLKARLNPQGG